MEKTAVISIDYDEFTPGSYRATVVTTYPTFGGGPEPIDSQRFSNGSLAADWADAVEHAKRSDAHVIASSACDNFCADDADNGPVLALLLDGTFGAR